MYIRTIDEDGEDTIENVDILNCNWIHVQGQKVIFEYHMRYESIWFEDNELAKLALDKIFEQLEKGDQKRALDLRFGTEG
jgi:hypothetical protein